MRAPSLFDVPASVHTHRAAQLLCFREAGATLWVPTHLDGSCHSETSDETLDVGAQEASA